MSVHYTLYQTTLHCILEDRCVLIFALKVLGFDGKKSISNIHLQNGKWLSEKKRKCSFSTALYCFKFWLLQWTKFSVNCKCHALWVKNQRLKNLAKTPTGFVLHTTQTTNQELHMKLHLQRFYHNSTTILYFIILIIHNFS